MAEDTLILGSFIVNFVTAVHHINDKDMIWYVANGLVYVEIMLYVAVASNRKSCQKWSIIFKEWNF